ncbi:hypothetical protein [Falsirhodobacter algicola]|uniref:Uncharacterized protein n=1 Tax=Falsirhodobacter algicola TaxID=2692330 RepID=A0A8J8SLG7_9RHOB|nr:hypothetical protein [Falsirhodobacter algicola]QUS36508.1 hypothetical protein GR316_09695 [Falsirhodobacter algicola]
MLEYLPDDLREEMRQAAIRKRRRGSRLHIQLGPDVFPLTRLWDRGLSIEAARLTHLRGVVDLFDGPRHIGHCLIVASVIDGDELVCEFKSFQPICDGPPVDFERTAEPVAGFLPAY